MVNAYRFATRGTAEECILRLQEKKRGLTEVALTENEAWWEGATAEELVEIFGGECARRCDLLVVSAI